MTFAEAFREALTLLEPEYGQREAGSIVKILAEDIFQVYSLQSARNISEEQFNKLLALTQQVLEGVPVQYIARRADFMGLQFYVNENVLIPRPETEELCDWIRSTFYKNQAIRILDIGTGSGCIAVSLVRYSEAWVTDAIDVSASAIEVASANARTHQVKIHFMEIDILHSSLADFKNHYDIIVSNPPYIGRDELADMDKNVLQSEPHIALFAGDDALVFYRKIATLAHDILTENGCLFFELNPKYAHEIGEICSKAGFQYVEVRKDMQGMPRMLKSCKTIV